MNSQTSLKGILKNRNVSLIILFNFLDGACFSLWSAQLLPVLVSRIGGDSAVGRSAAASGMAQIVGAALAGYVGDKLPRKETIRVGAFCGVVAVVATLPAIYLLDMHSIYITQALWGIYSGIVSTSTEALFADSVLSGHRAFIYNFKWIVQTVCYCVGYLVVLVMLLQMGNDWSMKSMKIVMTAGLAAHPLAHFVLLLLRDEDAIQSNDVILFFAEREQEGIEEQEVKKKTKKQQTQETRLNGVSCCNSEGALLLDERHAKDTNRGTILVPRMNEENAPDGGLGQGSEKQRENEEELLHPFVSFQSQAQPYLLCAWKSVPYLVCFAEFWMAVGSGMTVQYLTLFLVNDFKISPTWLMVSYIVISSCATLCATVLRYVGEHYVGRLPAVFVVRMIGTTLLLLMGLTHLNIFILIPIFIIRNSMMNSTMGVTRSVIMDCVPRSSRAKWSAWESFSSLTWAGSAVIGGYIAEAKGYQATFVITAVFHYIGISILIPAAIASRDFEKRLRLLKRAERCAD